MQPIQVLTVVTPQHAIAAARLGVSWDALKAKRPDLAPSEIAELRAAQGT